MRKLKQAVIVLVVLVFLVSVAYEINELSVIAQERRDRWNACVIRIEAMGVVVNYKGIDSFPYKIGSSNVHDALTCDNLIKDLSDKNVKVAQYLQDIGDNSGFYIFFVTADNQVYFVKF
jgi:hypothetical protein